MRISLLAPVLCAFTLAAPAVLAQEATPKPSAGDGDPVAAVRGFLTDADLLGADSATVGAVTADGDTLVATDVSMRWSTTFEVDEETVLLTASAVIDRLEVEGLTATGAGHAADLVVIPRARLAVAVEGADEPLAYDFTVTDYRLVDASWGAFPEIEADPDRPVSRFAPLVDWAIHQSYGLNEVGMIAGVVISGDDRQELSYGPLRYGPVVDGTLETVAFGPMTATQTTEMANALGETEAVEMTMRYGASRADGIDLRPLAALLTGNDRTDGPATVVTSVVFDGMTADAGDVFSMTFGENRIDGLAVDPPETPLMVAADDLVLAALAGEEPDPMELVALMLDLYGAFGMDLYRLADVEFASEDFTMAMGELLFERLSSSGLGLMALRGLEIGTPDGAGSLGAFEIADVVFPDREAFMATIATGMVGMQPDLRALLDAIPYLGRFTVSGLDVTAPGMGRIALGLFETRLQDFVAPIPTRVAIALEGLSLPATAAPDPQSAMMMQALGADPLTADGTVTLGWDETTSRLTLDGDVDVDNVGGLDVSAALAGIPRTVFENPMRAQEAIATAALGAIDVAFQDGGVTQFMLGMMAEQSGLEREAFVEGIVQQIRMQGEAMTGDGDFTGRLADAVATFLRDPRSLSIAISPADPVPFAQIMGAAMTAPQALPGLLNLSISANR